jgi:hypothetical protein
MPNLAALVKSCGVLTLAVALPLATGAAPARAQDLFGFFRLFSRPAPAPAYQPFEYRPDAASERPRPKPRSRPRPAPAEQAVIKMPDKPKAPGEIENPFPALLADSTLQPGDMVMFPDGLRVFTGRQGGAHRLADFKPIAQAGKAVSRATRKLVADLHPGENVAWSTDRAKAGGKLAANTPDVESTGSVKRTGTRRQPR